MDVRIEVKSADVMQKTIKGKGDGREYLIREQSGWIDLGKAYPQEVRVPLEDNKPPYPPGKYVMDPNCLYIDRFCRLSIGRLRLLPAK